MYRREMPHAHLDASILVSAPPQAVFDRMNDVSRFNDWNPFPLMDATTVSSHEGPASGPGAVFNYEGQRLGKGRMSIVEIDAPRRIDIAMTFWRGGSAHHAKSAFVLAETGGSTEVHWTFDEERGIGRYLMGKRMFRRMMTNTFRRGLETLKTGVEAEARG
jgi:carbon monoxide dehydrogenase subunit G